MGEGEKGPRSKLPAAAAAVGAVVAAIPAAIVPTVATHALLSLLLWLPVLVVLPPLLLWPPAGIVCTPALCKYACPLFPPFTFRLCLCLFSLIRAYLVVLSELVPLPDHAHLCRLYPFGLVWALFLLVLTRLFVLTWLCSFGLCSCLFGLWWVSLWSPASCMCLYQIHSQYKYKI